MMSLDVESDNKSYILWFRKRRILVMANITQGEGGGGGGRPGKNSDALTTTRQACGPASKFSPFDNH